MGSQLIAISGPLEGLTVDLTGAVTSIGRHPSSVVHVEDVHVSRRHCVLRQEAHRYRLEDLGSKQGTFVNGLPIKNRLLDSGDKITIGESLFLFVVDEQDPDRTRETPEIEEWDATSEDSLRRSAQDEVYRKTDDPQSQPDHERTARDLSVVFQFSRIVHSIRDSQALRKRLLELLLDAFPVQRAAILLTGDEEEFASVLVMDRKHGMLTRVRISHSITREVIRENTAILSNDVRAGTPYAEAESVADSGIHAVLCVPLSTPQRVIGVLYLDSTDPTVRLDAQHLEMATALGSVAAVALENTCQLESLRQEKSQLQARINNAQTMLGDGPRMREVATFIAKVAPSDATVLIRGETGTGKELAARAIHANSSRADQAFVPIHCAALTETLLESELFGHEKGAFTGATARKQGKLELADGGTVFLDEIGEIPPSLQVKLLRVLQEREFERVGGTRTIKLDVRLVAATNRDLEAAVQQGDLRQDLFYRLNVVALTMPPLRDRREDIPVLARHFAAKYGRRFRRDVAGLSQETLAYLQNYDWPGNVRELENAIERGVVLGSTELLLPEDLPENLLESIPPETTPLPAYHHAVRTAKRQAILRAIEQADGNYTNAAKLLGLHANYLHRLIRNLGLKKKPGK